MAVRNMHRTEIDIHGKEFIYKDHTGMHGQQDIKKIGNSGITQLLRRVRVTTFAVDT